MFRFIILIVALVAGGGAAWIAWSMRGESPAPAVVQVSPAVATLDVLVAEIDLAQGQTITKESVRWQAWPESAGEPIREEKLGPVNGGLLSSMLPSGKRAVAVRVTAENTAGGFILPNDRVDVLHTVGSHDKPEGLKDFTTRTILTNITVLAIDQTLDEKNKDEKSKAKPAAVGKTATLELDPRQAEMLTAAEAAGTLSLALRSTADNGEATRPPLPFVSLSAPQAVLILRGAGTTAPAKAP